MKRLSFSTAGLAVALAAATLGFGLPASAQPYGGWGMMGYGPGYGMMGGYGYGPGMMGYGGYGPGYMMGYGPGYGPRIGYGPYGQGNLNLSIDQVRDYFARSIAASGNSRLKVGEVKEQGPDSIVADIVTQDNSLVQEFVVDRHTGFYHPEQANTTNQPSQSGSTNQPTKP
jgi:hypothetical protein